MPLRSLCSQPVKCGATIFFVSSLTMSNVVDVHRVDLVLPHTTPHPPITKSGPSALGFHVSGQSASLDYNCKMAALPLICLLSFTRVLMYLSSMNSDFEGSIVTVKMRCERWRTRLHVRIPCDFQPTKRETSHARAAYGRRRHGPKKPACEIRSSAAISFCLLNFFICHFFLRN